MEAAPFKEQSGKYSYFGGTSVTRYGLTMINTQFLCHCHVLNGAKRHDGAVLFQPHKLPHKLRARGWSQPLHSLHLTKTGEQERNITQRYKPTKSCPSVSSLWPIRECTRNTTSGRHNVRAALFRQNDFSQRQADRIEIIKKPVHPDVVSTDAESLKDQFSYNWYICLKFTVHNISLNMVTSYILR